VTVDEAMHVALGAYKRFEAEAVGVMIVLAKEVQALREKLTASDAAHDVTHASLVRVADKLRALAEAPRYSTAAVDALFLLWDNVGANDSKSQHADKIAFAMELVRGSRKPAR
jgi:hypothetical protein